jgi:heat shock protein HslJ
MTKLITLLSISLLLSACSITKPISDEPLVDRYWRAVEIAGKPVVVTNNRAEPHVVFDMHQHTHGSDGCNRFNGEYVTVQGLRFGRLASTRMACAPPVDAEARDFTSALSKTVNYRISGRQIELLDVEDRVLMRLDATSLK